MTEPCRYIRKHCCVCDKLLEGWHVYPDAGVGFCDICIHKRPTDICFQCGHTCNHEIVEVDDEIEISDEQRSIIPDEFWNVENKTEIEAIEEKLRSAVVEMAEGIVRRQLNQQQLDKTFK